MSQTPASSSEHAPAGRRLVVSLAVAAVAAIIALVAFILPAEYNIDPLGVGRLFGLTELSEPAPATRTIEIADVVGGNEGVTQVEIPDAGEPVPLPNPAVHQAHDGVPPISEIFEITLPAESQTEVKMVMRTAEAALYSWHVDQGTIYSDFHGHTPEAGQGFFVRYIEHQETRGGSGSLVAPFDGEHNDFPVTVTLELTGYYDDVIDYGLF